MVGLIAMGLVATILDIVVSFIVRLIAPPEWYERWTWGG